MSRHRRVAATQPFIGIDGHARNTSASIGISLVPDDGENFDRLLRKADTAV